MGKNRIAKKERRDNKRSGGATGGSGRYSQKHIRVQAAMTERRLGGTTATSTGK
jgi:hypothetical protein